MKRPAPFTIFVARLAAAKRPEFSGPSDIAADAEEFRSLARRLDLLSTRECNGYAWGDRREGYAYPTEESAQAQQKRDQKNALRAANRAIELAAKYGFTVHFQSDARGLPLYLGYEGHMTDRNYSTTGIGVPL